MDTNTVSGNGQATTNRVGNLVDQILKADPKEYTRASPGKTANATKFSSRKDFMAVAVALHLSSYSAIKLKLNVVKDKDHPENNGKLKRSEAGNAGYSYCDKLDVTLPDGREVRCQVGINATILGSKEMDAATLETIRIQASDKGYAVPSDLDEVQPKAFSTGSVGWFANGKAEVDGRNCQFGVTISAIGSKEWAE